MKDKKLFDPHISFKERKLTARELLKKGRKQFTVALTDDKYNSFTEVMKDTFGNQQVYIFFKFYKPPAVIIKVKNGDAEKLAKFAENIARFKKKGVDVVSTIKNIYDGIFDEVKLSESSDSLIHFFVKKHKGINTISTNINILSEVVVNTNKKNLKTEVLFDRFVVYISQSITFNDCLSTVPIISDIIRITSKNGRYEILKDESRFPVMTDQLKYAHEVASMVKDIVDIKELKEFALNYLPKKFNFKIQRFLYDPLKPISKSRNFKVLRMGSNEYYKIRGKFTREEFKAIEDLFTDIVNAEIDQNTSDYSKWQVNL